VAEDVAWIRVEDQSATGAARRAATALAIELGFSEIRVAELGIAVTEIGTNLVKHATAGVLVVRSVRAVAEAAVEIVAIDSGPGIADLGRAWRDGESSTGTLGVGLGAVRRLTDSCTAFSEPGVGTVLTARFLSRRGTSHELVRDERAAGITRPITGEEVCGDAYAIQHTPGRLRLMLCDGSGHGPLAYSASRAAVRLFCATDSVPPEQVVARLHTALRGTRGGAVAVADLDFAARTVRFAGLGNVAANVLSPGRKQGMISVPGVAGYQARTIRAFDHPLPGGAVVVLHSDGLTERWTLDGRERLLTAEPLVIATTLLRDAGVRHDDAGVLVGKVPAV
jgi:anti-sigma regulatory factor (Ser/Thr protein kinase)